MFVKFVEKMFFSYTSMKIHLIVLLNTFNQKLFQEFNPDDIKTNFFAYKSILNFQHFHRLAKKEVCF